MSPFKLLGAIDGIISIKPHLKGDFGFNGFLDLAFFSWNISGIICKKGLDIFLALYLPKHYQYPHTTMIWWICDLILDVTIIKQLSFLLVNFFFFDISLIFPRTACFLCALCGKVTALFSFATKYTVQNP